MIINQHDVKRPVHACACGAHAWAALTRGYATLFDVADAGFVGSWSWSTLIDGSGKRRAVRRNNTTGKTFYLHREIMTPPSGFVVDHKNGDSLDNRRSNLRLCTQVENTWNSKPKGRTKSTPYKGVSADKATGRYQAIVKKHGKKVHLGRFATAEEAAFAYDAAAERLFGEFAMTNRSLGLLPQEG